jgi:murein DD-endopeptidase MepM/ murein hydrolase activator NlpD
MLHAAMTTKQPYYPVFDQTVRRLLFTCILVLILLSSGCLPAVPTATPPAGTPTPAPTNTLMMPTALPTRPAFQPGELVDYTAQMGDTLDALAQRFNTSVAEIRAANPIIPDSATTMPTGMPMKIPIYYRPLWGSPYQIIPDNLYVNGPAQRDFDPVAWVDQQPGWLKNYVAAMADRNRRGGEIIQYISTIYSISPRLLLAIIEYQSHALTNPTLPDPEDLYILGEVDYASQGLYRQLVWAADLLNDGYYNWRTGNLLVFEHLDGRLDRPDPWQNAATIALQYYFSRIMDGDSYRRAISGVGLAQTYKSLYGDPWVNVQPHIPGSLEQPTMRLPFEPGLLWAFTGGPHNAYGDEISPLAALDFAPPSVVGGCQYSDQWVTAVADGVISRSSPAVAVLDLDGDGDERTGWNVFYLHLDSGSNPPAGARLKAGDRIGRPSCEGGHATGTHVHIARKYNGEWVSADGALAFNMEGWIARNGSAPYQGTLYRNGRTISACVCSDHASQVESMAPVNK